MTPTIDWIAPMAVIWTLSLWECVLIGYKRLSPNPLTKADYAWLACNVLVCLLWAVVVIGWVFEVVNTYWMLVLYSVPMMLTVLSQFGKRLLGRDLAFSRAQPDARFRATISVIVIAALAVSAVVYIAFTVYLAVSHT